MQYHAPVYRALQASFDVPVTVIYGADFSVAGYRDSEFGVSFAWDTDLLSGYIPKFLSRVSNGGAQQLSELSARGLTRALYEAKPRAVLLLGYGGRFNQMAFYQTWRAGYPILFRGETTDHARQRSRIRNLVRDRVLRWCYQESSRLLYIGKRSYQHYGRLGCPNEKLVFSPYCVDISPFEFDEAARSRLRDATREKLEIKKDDIVLVVSGKLSRRKGPDLLLQAVKQLTQSVRERIVVVFLGFGQLAEELQQMAEDSPRVKVRFLGFKNQTHLSRYYHAGDLLVLASREGESWGLVVNEALQHGLPCIVSKAVGCAPDLIESGVTGELFETGSAESLAVSLRLALTLVGRCDVRNKCREKVGSYSVEKAAEGIARAYTDVAKECRGAR